MRAPIDNNNNINNNNNNNNDNINKTGNNNKLDIINNINDNTNNNDSALARSPGPPGSPAWSRASPCGSARTPATPLVCLVYYLCVMLLFMYVYVLLRCLPLLTARGLARASLMYN